MDMHGIAEIFDFLLTPSGDFALLCSDTNTSKLQAVSQYPLKFGVVIWRMNACLASHVFELCYLKVCY